MIKWSIFRIWRRSYKVFDPVLRPHLAPSRLTTTFTVPKLAPKRARMPRVGGQRAARAKLADQKTIAAAYVGNDFDAGVQVISFQCSEGRNLDG